MTTTPPALPASGEKTPRPALSPTPKPTPTTQDGTPLSLQGWVYPGAPACSAMTEITDGRHIDVLKPQYYTLLDDGTLQVVPQNECNGYSQANAALVVAHSSEQFVTISGTINGILQLTASAGKMATMTQGLLTFLLATGFTGVELDIEGASGWTSGQYLAYKSVVGILGLFLHNNGYKLMIDGPVITGTTYQGYYPNWKWEDFNALPVDQMVAMCYDLQDDGGVGSPVSSFQEILACCAWMKAHIKDPQHIVIGVNSYGYFGTTGTYTSTNLTYEQVQRMPGFGTATRDRASGEMMWTQGNTFYDYSDATTLNEKVQTILSTGLSHVSIWHIGGNNPYPTFPQPAPVPQPAPTPDSALSAFATRYPGFDGWYQAHFDTQGNYHE